MSDNHRELITAGSTEFVKVDWQRQNMAGVAIANFRVKRNVERIDMTTRRSEPCKEAIKQLLIRVASPLLS